VSYVDAGYTIALATLCIYGIGLGLRRRRWERAVTVAEVVAEDAAEDTDERVFPGARS
jgi:hypothetical protein